MKRMSFFFLIFLVFLLTSSCSNEDLFDILSENTDETPIDNDDEDSSDDENPFDPDLGDVQPEGELEVNSTPCDFNLEDVLVANTTIEIECQLDLGGTTVNVPEGVTLAFNGGEIINGTLNFAGNGKIEGNLLNQFLELTGDVSLTDEVFQFHPERWDFIQGRTSSERAQQNNFNLENLFVYVQNLGANDFVINKFDAYFEISKVTSTTTNQNFYPSQEAINIPSNFTLRMTENTHLRTQPNNSGNGVLLSFRDVSNSAVIGGTLHGDRDEHDYSGFGPGEGGTHLLVVHAARSIVIDGVKLINGSKGGLNINSLGFTFQPHYEPTRDVVVRNCIFEKNRRMAVALTDGYDIIFDGNQFIDNANPTANSDGGVVGFSVNLEPVRKRENGELVYYEKVHDIVFRNNSERGSRVGAVNIYIGDNVIVENNQFENKVGWSYASNCKIKNNTFTASEVSAQTPAINAIGSGETVFNNEISGNTITGYGLAMAVYHGKIKVFGNDIQNNGTGIQLKSVNDVEIFDNTIESSKASSRGVNVQLTSADNVDIRGNRMSVTADPLYFVQVNKDSEAAAYRLNIENNSFESPAKLTFSNSNGISLNSNESEAGVQIINVSNMEVNTNTINTDNSNGIHLRQSNSNISISSNVISVPPNTRYECIKNDSSSSSIDIDSNNQCDS